MKQVLGEVFEMEDKVAAILEGARFKASEIKSSADKAVSERTAEAKERSREILQRAIEAAKKEGEALGDEKLKAAEREKEELLKGNAGMIDGLVGDICKIILTTHCETGA